MRTFPRQFFVSAGCGKAHRQRHDGQCLAGSQSLIRCDTPAVQRFNPVNHVSVVKTVELSDTASRLPLWTQNGRKLRKQMIRLLGSLLPYPLRIEMEPSPVWIVINFPPPFIFPWTSFCLILPSVVMGTFTSMCPSPVWRYRSAARFSGNSRCHIVQAAFVIVQTTFAEAHPKNNLPDGDDLRHKGDDPICIAH